MDQLYSFKKQEKKGKLLFEIPISEIFNQSSENFDISAMEKIPKLVWIQTQL